MLSLSIAGYYDTNLSYYNIIFFLKFNKGLSTDSFLTYYLYPDILLNGKHSTDNLFF